MLLESLSAVYDEYLSAVYSPASGSSPLRGMLAALFPGRAGGWDDANRRFAESAAALLDAFCAGSPSPSEAAAAAEYVLRAGEGRENDQAVFLMLTAMHSRLTPLVPLLPRADAQRFAEYYDAHFPARERTPAMRRLRAALDTRCR